MRDARPADRPAIERLLDQAFGPARHWRTAARLRAHSRPLYARVAASGGQIFGSVAIHPVRFVGPGGEERPLCLLGPLVADPARRGEGIGLALMAEAVDWLDGVRAPCALIGDAPYYGRFGFEAGATALWRLPGPVDPARLLLRAATPSAFSGPALLLPAQALALAA